MSFISPDDYVKFVPENIIFETAKQNQGDHGQKFHRISLKYKYPTGIGPLVVQTPILFTYGISTGNLAAKKEMAAPQLSLVSYDTLAGPTQEQTEFLNLCGKILSRVKDHLMSDSVKEDLDKWDMDADVHAMKIFYVKMEKGKPVKGYPPTLYSKLFYRMEDGEMTVTSTITDANTGEPLPAKPLLGRGKVYAAVMFPNIFVGSKPSLQTRIGEVMVVELSGRTQFLKPLAQHDDEDCAPPPVLKFKTIKKKYPV